VRFVLGRALFVAVLLTGCGEAVLAAEQPASEGDGGSEKPFLVCGSKRCENIEITDLNGVKITLFGCCKNSEKSLCGLVAPPFPISPEACLAVNQVGKVDPNCPPLTVRVLGTFQGCCAENGTCGVYDTQYGFGCGETPYSSLVPCVYSP
jgi:hypothetical protein